MPCVGQMHPDRSTSEGILKQHGPLNGATMSAFVKKRLANRVYSAKIYSYTYIIKL